MPRTWLVTGGSRGLGRALCEAVVAAGDNLVATARDASTLADLVAKGGERVLVAALDVTDADAALSAVAGAVNRFGGLDIVVNNAGYGDVAPIEDTGIDEFRAQIETNLFGTIIVTKAAIPLFRERRAGRFIQISSIGGRVGAMGVDPIVPPSSAWRVFGGAGGRTRAVRRARHHRRAGWLPHRLRGLFDKDRRR